MKHSANRIRRLLLVFLGGTILITLTVGIVFHLSTIWLTGLVLVLGLIFAATWLWHQANVWATGDEWWQDDQASGWRGY